MREMALEEVGRVVSILARTELKGDNRFKGIGLSLMDYCNTMRDVMKKQAELQGRMAGVMTAMTSPLGLLEQNLRDMKDEQERLEQARLRLNAGAKQLLQTGRLTESTGDWKIQRLNNLNGATTVQSISQFQGKLIVTQEADRTSRKVVQTVRPGDLNLNDKEVQRVSGSDLWSLTIYAKGNAVKKETSQNGRTSNDSQSSIVLYFSSADLAEAAADQLLSER